MASSKTKKQWQPSVDYQLAPSEGKSVDNAFDILFEETLRQISDLTTNDN